jgi:hypothetical protein
MPKSEKTIYENMMRALETGLKIKAQKGRGEGVLGRMEEETKRLEEQLEEQLKVIREQFNKLTGGIIDDIGNALLKGKPEEVVSMAGKKIDGAFTGMSNALMKTHPAIGLVAKALRAGIKWWIGLSETITKTNREILSSARAMNLDIDTRKKLREMTTASYEAEVALMKDFSMETEDVKKALNTMISAGFKPASKDMNEFVHSLTSSFVLLGKQGLGLSEQAIHKFNKVLAKEYNLNNIQATVLLKDLSDQLTEFNVSQEEELAFYTDLIEKGRDYSLTLGTIKEATKEAKDAGLSFTQTIRQISEVSMLGRRMGLGQRAFWGQRLGEGDMWTGAAQIRTGEMGQQGTRMLQIVAKEAGLDFKKLGEMTIGEAEKFTLFATKLTDMTDQAAFLYASSNKEFKKHAESLKLDEKQQKEHMKSLSDLTGLYKDAAEWFSKLMQELKSEAAREYYRLPRKEEELFQVPEIKSYEEEVEAALGRIEPVKEKVLEKQHSGGIIGFQYGGINTQADDTVITAKKGEMILTEDQQLNLFNAIDKGELGGEGREINFNFEGSMFEGIEPYIKNAMSNAINNFFQDKSLGM